jgi:hypothetical protein
MIRLKIRVSLLSLLLVIVPASASAQRIDQLREGVRVKVVPHGSKEILGTASLVTPDSMTITYEGSLQTTRIGLRDLAHVEVSTGVSRAKGGLIYGLMGLAIGGLGGAALGAAAPSSCTEDNPFICGRAASAYVGGVLGGFVGTVAGIAGGASKGWEGWRTVPGDK